VDVFSINCAGYAYIIRTHNTIPVWFIFMSSANVAYKTVTIRFFFIDKNRLWSPGASMSGATFELGGFFAKMFSAFSAHVIVA
jgi:hypothetical protein